jgi:hypothetical protein
MLLSGSMVSQIQAIIVHAPAPDSGPNCIRCGKTSAPTESKIEELAECRLSVT